MGKTRQRNSAWKHKHFLRHDTESVNLMKRCAVKNNTSKFPRPLSMKSRLRIVSDDADPTINHSVSAAGAEKEPSIQRIPPVRISSESHRERSVSELGNKKVMRPKTHNYFPSTPNTTSCEDIDPLLDEKLGYEHYLGQDFKSYMSVLDENLDINKLDTRAIDTNINFNLVFHN